MATCDRFREAISARLDGEDLAVSDLLLEGHLASCQGCRGYAEQAAALDRQVRVRPVGYETARDRTAEILAALNHERRPAAAGSYRRHTGARVGLAALGVLQLAIALPVTLFGHGGPSGHSLRELGSFQLALAAGFLLVSARPVYARGLLPVAATLALCLAVVAGQDILAGQAVATRESVHLIELGGFALLWWLRGATPRDGAPQPA